MYLGIYIEILFLPQEFEPDDGRAEKRNVEEVTWMHFWLHFWAVA